MTNPIIPSNTGLTQKVLGMTHINKVLPGTGTGLIMEVTAPPGLGAPPHVHDEDAEAFYILEGELTVETEGKIATLRPGDMCALPAGIEHTFRNDSDRDVRFLAVITPGIDALAFFTEVDRAGAAGGLTPDTVMTIGTAHGLAFAPAA
ncbi:MAG: cupin domain-containing protein [Hyphomonas sp.]